MDTICKNTFFLFLAFRPSVRVRVCVHMCRVGNQEQMLHAKSGGRGGRAGHSCEMTSHHSHTPAQECWENRQGRPMGGWVVGDAGWVGAGGGGSLRRVGERGWGRGGFGDERARRGWWLTGGEVVSRKERRFIRPVARGSHMEAAGAAVTARTQKKEKEG